MDDVAGKPAPFQNPLSTLVGSRSHQLLQHASCILHVACILWGLLPDFAVNLTTSNNARVSNRQASVREQAFPLHKTRSA